uniref:Uncharacterized protein n=1 Tax=Glycine max TaxID=3847 RepID=C6T914_SOYBN|nr:unknown [Glycine max]
MEIALSLPLERCHVHVGTSFGSITPTLSEKRSMFILGMGFFGQSLARKLHNQGWLVHCILFSSIFTSKFKLSLIGLMIIGRVVSGTCTTHVKKKELQEMGFNVHLFDANHPDVDVLQVMKNYSHILVSVPPLVGIGDPMLRHEELLRSSLTDGDLRWLCYLSSTNSNMMTETLSALQVSMETVMVNWWMRSKRV